MCEKEIVGRYQISFCNFDRICEVQSFIDTHWKTNHVLAKKRMLLDWQHYDASTKHYNFVVATDLETQKIEAILGFIPTYHFDPTLKSSVDIWGAIWKTTHNASDLLLEKNGLVMGLGSLLLEYLVSKKNVRSYGAIGINGKVAKLYRYLGFSVGHLNHYYIINRKRDNFNLIEGFNGLYFSSKFPPKKLVFSIDDANPVFPTSSHTPCLPLKSKKYLIKKYVENLFYKYFFLNVQDGFSEGCSLACRIARANNSQAIRIVDFSGNLSSLSGGSTLFQNLLESHDAEYIDFYSYGIPEEIFKKAGFLKRPFESPLIIPNYFEPFERRNINIMFAYKFFSSSSLIYNVCKGDADQERPNLL